MSPMPPNVPYAAPPTVPRTSGLAVTSLVLGIGSLACSLFAGIPALICGGIALAKINRPGSGMLGRGQATAGMVLGGISLLLLPVFAIVAAVALPLVAGRDSARESVCRNNGGQIYAAMRIYALNNDDRMPARPEDLKPYLDSRSLEETFRCPAQEAPGRPAGARSYELVRTTGKWEEMTPDTVLAREVPGNHRAGRRMTVFADGHVEMRSD